VPSVGETLEGYDADTWAGVGVPRGTPAAIIERLNQEINAGLADSAIKARLMDIGTVPKIFSAQEFGTFVAAENEKWAKVVRAANIKPELHIP
jgi:tripartite-type tricarboxylate transporter receptor subunit TctC